MLAPHTLASDTRVRGQSQSHAPRPPQAQPCPRRARISRVRSRARPAPCASGRLHIWSVRAQSVSPRCEFVSVDTDVCFSAPPAPPPRLHVPSSKENPPRAHRARASQTSDAARGHGGSPQQDAPVAAAPRAATSPLLLPPRDGGRPAMPSQERAHGGAPSFPRPPSPRATPPVAAEPPGGAKGGPSLLSRLEDGDPLLASPTAYASHGTRVASRLEDGDPLLRVGGRVGAEDP